MLWFCYAGLSRPLGLAVGCYRVTTSSMSSVLDVRPGPHSQVCRCCPMPCTPTSRHLRLPFGVPAPSLRLTSTPPATNLPSRTSAPSRMRAPFDVAARLCGGDSVERGGRHRAMQALGEMPETESEKRIASGFGIPPPALLILREIARHPGYAKSRSLDRWARYTTFA